MYKMIHAVLFAVLASLLAISDAKSADEWKSRVIYQLLTDRFHNPSAGGSCGNLRDYCGGTFQGVIKKLDYIQGLGVNAIWISPVVENTPGGYHGYWAKNISNINPKFGSPQDLKDLVSACHARGIWVMVDVVGNHMGYPPGCPGCSMQQETDFSSLWPFNRAEHYHNYCDIKNWGDAHEVEYCRLAELPDLNQDNSYVRETLKAWIHNLVQTYGFDGIRIDTIPEVKPQFWNEFGQSSGVFQIGEVDNGDPDYDSPFQGPLTSVLNYPMYWTLRNVFQQKSAGMRTIGDRLREEAAKFKDMTVLGGFVDNHDNPRFLSINKDWTSLKNALAYTLMARWIPIVYYGTEQAYAGGNDPYNRESLWPNYNTNHLMYQFIAQVNAFRNKLGSAFYDSAQNERWRDDSFYAFTRGNGESVLVCVSNQGSGSTEQRDIGDLPYHDGTTLQNILDTSDKITANGGKVSINIQNGQPKIYHVLSGEHEGTTESHVTPRNHGDVDTPPTASHRVESGQEANVLGIVVGVVGACVVLGGIVGYLGYKKLHRRSYVTLN
ncbi:acid alpha-amylase [Lingula anatina]|uniref:alpha-amylase n=1 Tax=Lingula anatina TaxID=7574 RepID=A0A1S3IDX0_LINAN|nr:acid alpha-amylase [Lingula anatina]|eukprot:XP_013396432.1 acid alpha-amylase [Lingula anatina]